MPDSDRAPEKMTGSLDITGAPDEQRVTAPLTRDNSRVNPSPGDADTTRQIFGQPSGPPAPPPPPRAYPQTSQQAPVQPQSAYPGGDQQGSQRVTPMGWAFRGLVLLMVAVVSGLIWHAIKPASKTPESSGNVPVPQGKYDFKPFKREEDFQGCRKVSTAEIAGFFRQHECDHLTRAIYTTTLPNGQRVATSVITVLMQDAASAEQLKKLTTVDNTGNVQDLVDAKRPDLKGFPNLDDDGYAVGGHGRLVVLGDSAYFGQPSKSKDPVLVDVTTDALRLGQPQDGTPN